MKCLTWNVNGIRAIQKKGFEQILDFIGADLVCIQETKAQPEQIEVDPGLYPYQYAYSAVKKGYSGTMILSAVEPISVRYGLGIEELDQEGRVICAEFEDFYCITVYTPNAQENLKRIDFRMKWDEAFGACLKALDKPFILCGDFNVALTPLDIYDDQANEQSPGYSIQEQEGFNKYILSNCKDVFRELYPEKRQYTWWSYFGGRRPRNEGWRIDYWLVSASLLSKVQEIRILDDVFGSDHCPVEMDIDLLLKGKQA